MKRLPIISSLSHVLAVLAPVPAMALAMAVLAPQPAYAEPKAKLVVSITDIADHRGTLRLAVFDKDGYDTDQPVAGAEIAVTSGAATTVIDGLAPGRYGVKLFHDVNDDGQMNTNPFGMPVEPFAFSNNARGQFGPAKWDAAAFDVGEGETTHAIQLVRE